MLCLEIVGEQVNALRQYQKSLSILGSMVLSNSKVARAPAKERRGVELQRLVVKTERVSDDTKWSHFESKNRTPQPRLDFNGALCDSKSRPGPPARSLILTLALNSTSSIQPNSVQLYRKLRPGPPGTVFGVASVQSVCRDYRLPRSCSKRSEGLPIAPGPFIKTFRCTTDCPGPFKTCRWTTD